VRSSAFKNLSTEIIYYIFSTQVFGHSPNVVKCDLLQRLLQ